MTNLPSFDVNSRTCEPRFEEDNYHLLGLDDCARNRGYNPVGANLLIDADFQDRIYEGTVDIGADEYCPPGNECSRIGGPFPIVPDPGPDPDPGCNPATQSCAGGGARDLIRAGCSVTPHSNSPNLGLFLVLLGFVALLRRNDRKRLERSDE